MSAKEPTTPKDGAAAVSAAEHWRELEGRTGDAPDTEGELATSGVEPEGTEEEGRKRVLSRRARVAVAALLIAFGLAPAWIVVPALVGEGSTRRSRSTPGALPSKARRADRRGSGRTRWVREPDASAQPRQRRTPLGAPQGKRRAHPRHGPPSSASPAPEAASRPPASGTTPSEPLAEPSEPAPPSASKPKGKPGLRDGATESAEFGL